MNGYQIEMQAQVNKCDRYESIQKSRHRILFRAFSPGEAKMDGTPLGRSNYLPTSFHQPAKAIRPCTHPSISSI